MFRDVLVTVVFIVIFFLPLMIKKKRQLGPTWKSGVSARLNIAKIPLICKHCEGDLFYKREALIPTSFFALFAWTCWNKSGRAFVCKNCGLIHWFHRSVESDIEFIRDLE